MIKKVLFALLWTVLFAQWIFAAAPSLCASVKIEIKQELTLERQAFEAKMKINNGISHAALENVKVDVLFTDENGAPVLATSDPNNLAAKFFIRVDTMQGINNVNGSGVVAASSTAEITWLIIPAIDASNGNPFGTLYYVGARLSYLIGSDQNETEVSPDFIYVKPLPELTLDYFLPGDVYGDDPMTAPIEPIVPFNLGLRIRNAGFGVAKELKVDSAQPKIVENELGLLVGFMIEGCEVNGGEVQPTLLADFGDIEPDSAGIARWVMTASLSGRFTEFSASFSHADELGGKLTSVITDPINTHYLVRDVLVDIQGRDEIRDFLADDAGTYMVYESDNIDTAVQDKSASASFTFKSNAGNRRMYELVMPVGTGFSYVKLPDPFKEAKVIDRAVRGDGKIINPANVWLSKHKNESKEWEYYFNLFDTNAVNGTYEITFTDIADVPQAPVVQYIPDRLYSVGKNYGFIVESYDANNTIPLLLTSQLPYGATFADNGDGTGEFAWTPAAGQEGTYTITFYAADEQFSTSRTAVITVFSDEDSDGDGMLDSWEMLHFINLSRDGSGDFDRDGITDYAEFINNTDPVLANAPDAPMLMAPELDSTVRSLYPVLKVRNCDSPSDDPLYYDFEIFGDSELTDPVVQKERVPAGTDVVLENGTPVYYTTYRVTEDMSDDCVYYWRSRARDASALGQWTYGRFTINTADDSPAPCTVVFPEDMSEVSTLRPEFLVYEPFDVNEGLFTYRIELYDDVTLSTLIEAGTDLAASGGMIRWEPAAALDNNAVYYWRIITIDVEAQQTVSPVYTFSTDEHDLINQVPAVPVIKNPVDNSTVTCLMPLLEVAPVFDGDGDDVDYVYEVYEDVTLSTLVYRDQTGDVAVTVPQRLTNMQRYYLRVKAVDGRGESVWSETAAFYVYVADEPPLAVIDYSPVTPVAGRLITFNGRGSSDNDGEITAYFWDLDGDGVYTDATGDITGYTFAHSGDFPVGLRIVDDGGNTDESVITVGVINIPPEPVVSYADIDHYTGTAVLFSGTDSTDNGTVVRFHWDLNNDGEFDDASGDEISHAFNDDGVYPVGLQVTDNEGMSGYVYRDIMILNRAPVAAFTLDQSSGDNRHVVFIGTASQDADGSIVTYRWDFENDGVFDATGNVVAFDYPASGTYRAVLEVVDDDGAAARTSVDVVITNKVPTAHITHSPANPYTGEMVTLYGSDSTDDGAVVSYAWDLDFDGVFDDGEGETVTLSKPVSGSYRVGLRVTDDEGAAGETTYTLMIQNRVPVALIEYLPLDPHPDVSVMLNGGGSYDSDGMISLYAWDLDNDGVYDNGTGSSITTSFAGAGSYTVGLRVTDNDGASADTSVVIEVTLSTVLPVSNFSVDSEHYSTYLTWDNPVENWAGTLIVRKKDSVSSGPADGETVYDGRDNFYVDTCPDEGRYYYSAYAYSVGGIYADAAVMYGEVPALYGKHRVTYQQGGANPHGRTRTLSIHRRDTYNDWDASILSVGRSAEDRAYDLWIAYPDIIGSEDGKVPVNAHISSACLSLDVHEMSGDTGAPVRLLLYGIKDPDGLGMPYYGNRDGFRKGLNYRYRDHRPGMDIPWTADEGTVMDLIGDDAPAAVVEFIPDVMTDGTVRFDVTSVVQQWAASQPNQGFFITAEGSALVELYGVESQMTAHRPRLDVVYTLGGAQASVPGVDTPVIECGDGVLELSWVTLSNDVAGTKVIRKTGGIPFDAYDGEVIYDGANTRVTDTNVDNGVLYYYALFTYDQNREYSQKVWLKGIPGTPARPAVTITPAAGSLLLGWDAVAGAESYVIYKMMSGDTEVIRLETADTSYSDAHVDIVEYTYRVAALNAYGEGIRSTMVSGVPLPTDALPAAPVLTGLSVISGTEISLTWTDNAENESAYVVERMDGDVWSEVAVIAANSKAFTDTGLTPGRVYQYRVAAKNGAGTSGYSTVLSGTTLDLPAKPENLVWYVISANKIKLVWEAGSVNTSSYRVELYQAGELIKSAVMEATLSTRYYLNGLSPGTDYIVKLIALNNSGENSVESEIIRTVANPVADVF